MSGVLPCRNRLYALDYNLRFADKVLLQPEKGDVQYCRLRGYSEEHCQNYIKVVAVRGSRLLVCGTHARKPKCHYRKREDISKVTEHLPRKVQMCPEDPDSSTTVQLPVNSSAVFVGLAGSMNRGILRYFGRPDPLTTDMNNFNILRLPQFISSYTLGSSVFFFARELTDVGSLRFYISRVARVCQSDTGGRFLSPGRWTSFVKSRLKCIQPGGSGQLQYDYNFLVDVSFTEKDGRRHAFAVFQPPTSGPAGGAVCMYGFDGERLRDDILSVFDGPYVGEKRQHSMRRKRNHCDKPRSESNALRYTETSRPIRQATNAPLVTKSGARLLAIAADAISQSTFVLFVACDEGTIDKFLVTVTETETTLRGYMERGYVPVVTLIDTIRVIPMEDLPRSPIYNMLIVKEQNAVFVGTETDIVRIPLSRCDLQYDECSDCIGSRKARDPYCGWCTGTHKCSVKNDCLGGSWITKQDNTSCPGKTPFVTGVPPVVTSTWSSHLDVSHNERILLNCSANGVPPPSYWWKKDGEILHEATGAEYVIPAVHLANGGEYVCLAQNRFGNTTVKTVVRVIPEIIEKAPTVVIAGPFDSLALPCGVVGSPVPVVTWRKRGVLVTDDSKHGVFVSKSGSLVFTTLSPNDAGMYECEAVNHCGRSSYTTQVFVTYDAVSNYKSRIVKEGDTVELSCSLCKENCTFTWTKDGESLEKTNSKTLTIRNARKHDTGQYCCTEAKDKDFRTEVHLVKVLVPPTVVARSAANVTAAANASAIFYLDVTGEPSPYVRWSKEGKDVGSSSRVVVTGTTGRFSFVVDNLHLSDSGIYVATIYNSIASKDVAFSLFVFGQRQCPPLVTRATEGGTLSFTCRYSNDISETIGGSLLPVTWKGPHLRVRPRADSVSISRRVKSTSVKLTIRNVTVSNEGEYECHAYATHGHSVCRWWVGVTQRNATSTHHPSSSTRDGAEIGMSAVVFGCIIVCTVLFGLFTGAVTVRICLRYPQKCKSVNIRDVSPRSVDRGRRRSELISVSSVASATPLAVSSTRSTSSRFPTDTKTA
ncbi:hemicentin-2-like [Corticium candelabrum]|uniref:hemicentin-2-like n=1 Tax=Corticium candelabrum TaxID=121492 RepID=UPI002E274922|nr:hemicentin-2-like [Corticium candelabrum]